ncbi:MAG TPA: amino acid permease, partial [Candidatus Saccharimonadales bacterium]|nr:amino acid permease [Candidatus Saccharimonadales bacterium]
YVATFPIMLGFMLGLVLAFYPGANIFVTLGIGFVLAMPLILTYAMASTVLKRSGGDYVFISRTIHPAIGFAANMVFVLFQTVYLTSTGYYFCVWGLSPLARFLGVELGNASLVSLSNSLVQPFAIFVVGELFVLGFAALFIFGSIRGVLKVFRYTMIVSLIGLAATVVALVLTSPAAVQTAFDSYVKVATGVTGASQAVLASATANGYTPASFDLGLTILAVSWAAFSLPFYLGSAYFAGEVRSARLSQLLAGPITAIIAFVAALVLAFLALNAIGQTFLASLVAASPSATGLGGAPTYMEVAAIATGNPLIGSLIIIGFASWLFPTVPMSLLIMTRCIFAWSMDRVVPDGLSKVTERSNSPVNAVIVVSLVSVVVAWAWAYTSIFTVVVGAFGQILALGIGSLGAALIPYKFKGLYDLSPVGWYWGRIPVLSVVGVAGAIGALLMVANFARDPNSGVSISASPGMFWFSLALFPIGIAIYFISRALRRRQGFDIDLAYAEIPPD